MRTFAKSALEKDHNGETVSSDYQEGNCSKADTPNNVPLVEVHCEFFCELISVVMRNKKKKTLLFVRGVCGENLPSHVSGISNRMNAVWKISLRANYNEVANKSILI